MFPVLVTIVIALALAVWVAPSRPRRVLGLLLALPVGLVVYFALGIGVARWRGVGRFYSLPLGGEHISDSDVVVSLVFWICAAGLAIQWLLPKAKRSV